jgi:hypothetical protein
VLLGWMRQSPFRGAENTKLMIRSMKSRENAQTERKRSPAADTPRQRLLPMGKHPRRWWSKNQNAAIISVYILITSPVNDIQEL